MAKAIDTELARARADTLQAGRILSLLRLQISRNGAMFSPIYPVYAAMLDPHAGDERRHAACIAMLEPVRKHAIVEEMGVRVENSREYHNPYRVEYTTTMRGALLEICAAFLADAIAGFEKAGIVPAQDTRRTAP
ncbi:MAG: hypothetical protein Q4G49_07570 [Paracoccus sp. (in: a-proteobacteria)]|nr:hypothetical protein [Paracoccus sp. (in: a-proteobacteria)]